MANKFDRGDRVRTPDGVTRGVDHVCTVAISYDGEQLYILKGNRVARESELTAVPKEPYIGARVQGLSSEYSLVGGPFYNVVGEFWVGRTVAGEDKIVYRYGMRRIE